MSALRTVLWMGIPVMLLACGSGGEIEQPAPPPEWPMGGADPDKLDLEDRVDAPPTAPPRLSTPATDATDSTDDTDAPTGSPGPASDPPSADGDDPSP